LFSACLKSERLINVATGPSPSAPCKTGEMEVHWNAEGEPGRDGATMLNGAGSPTPDLGREGDMYVDLDTGWLFVKEAGAWHVGASVIGPSGPSGPAGPEGPPGPAGALGILHQPDFVSRVEIRAVHPAATEVGRLRLGPGLFLVTASGELSARTGRAGTLVLDASVVCGLSAGNRDLLAINALGATATDWTLPYTAQAIVTHVEEADVVLECALQGSELWANGGFVRLDLEDWIAIRAGP
jgi:hypothetical protein